MALPGKHILIIVENLPVPFDKRVWNEANALTRAGYKVSIISPVGKGSEKRREDIEGISIHRHPVLAEGNGVLGYLVEYVSALFWELTIAMRIHVSTGFDAIHACNPPDTIFLIGGLFKLLGKKFVFDHHDINPELFIAKFGKKGLFYRLITFLEWMTFKTADISIATNESYKEIAVTRGGMDPRKVFVVRSGPDLEKFRPVLPQDQLKEGRRHLVGYVGVMGKQEGLNYLLDAVKIIVEERGRKDILFVIIGSGTEFDEIQRYASDIGVGPSVRFTGRIPDTELIAWLSTADVCVNPDVANEMNDKSTMNKIMEYMALGKPVVQFDLTEGRRSAQDASLYARKNDPADFARKIVQLLDDPARREAMGKYGKERVENCLAWEFSGRVLCEAYARLFHT